MNRGRMIERLRALMAKTVENGCTQQEMLLALEKVQQLRAEYDITDAELRGPDAAPVGVFTHGGADPLGAKNYLGAAIATFCQVKCWRQDGQYRFAGFASDVAMADFLLESLGAFVQREAAAYMVGNRAKGPRRARMLSGFVVGASATISRRLKELSAVQEAHQQAGGRAIVPAKQAAIGEFLKALGFQEHGPSKTRRRVNGDAREAGREAGERASFGRPIQGGGRQLPAR